jgi:hypothetical protein
MHDEDEAFGLFDGICQACDTPGPVDDMSLCEDCAGKFERDVIRRRDWDFSAMAFACPKDRLEDLRTEVIRKYGEALELLAPKEEDQKKQKGSRKRRH